MSESIKIFVVIPAFNEENSVARVIGDLPLNDLEEVIVVNNNSNDNTSTRAREAGATVLDERIPGYGRACLKGIDYAFSKMEDEDILVFLDADYSDYPEQLPELIEPIKKDWADLVVGSRELGIRERQSMTFPQIFGNKFAALLIKMLYGQKITDLGPFRAINKRNLMTLHMMDKTYGWTVEMQVKAFKNKLRYAEVPVNYRKRIGFSKISGTVKGTFMAGYKIISTILKYK